MRFVFPALAISADTETIEYIAPGGISTVTERDGNPYLRETLWVQLVFMDGIPQGSVLYPIWFHVLPVVRSFSEKF